MAAVQLPPGSSAEAKAMQRDPRIVRCGFCKLEGEDLDFVSRRYEVTIGRRSKTTPLDVVLGTQLCHRMCGDGLWSEAVTEG